LRRKSPAAAGQRQLNTALGGMNRPTVRLAQKGEFPALQSIERAAARRFAESDLPAELRDQTLTAAELQDSLNQGLLWVVEVNTELRGFLAACEEGSGMHILEMSVLPSHGRKGYGRSLLEVATHDAKNRDLASVTLTTFSHIAWNGPAYAKAGFRVVAESSLTPELARRLAEERKHGLGNRVAMQRSSA
jgi:N-acetylglutamate synthase-like GNAT family acetyltransferase